MNYYFKVLGDYATFKGRASRSEYWYFILFNLIISFAFGFICGILNVPDFAYLYNIFVLLPAISVGVRRLHDVGKSGWFLLVPVYNLILLCKEGEGTVNNYGLELHS